MLLPHSLTLSLRFSSTPGASPPFSHLTTTVLSSPPGASPPFSHLTTTVLFPSRCVSSILSPYHYCSLPLQGLLLHSLTLPLPLLFSSTPGASPPFSHLTTTTTVLFSPLQVLLLHSLTLPLLFSSLSPPGASSPFSHLTATVLFSLPSRCFSSILSPYHYHYCSLLSPLQVLLLHSLSLPLPLLFSSLSPPGASPPFSYLTTTTTVLFSLPSRCFSSILLPYHYHYCSLLSPLQVLLLHSLTLPLLFSSLSPPGASPPFSHLTTTTTVLFSLLFQVLLLYFLSLPLPLLFSSLSPPGASPPFSYLTTTVLLPSRCFSSILSPYHYHYCSLLSPLQVLLLHSLTLPLLFSSLSSSRCFFSILSPYHYHYCSLLSPLQVLLLHSLSLPLPLLFSSLSPPGASPPFSYLTTTTTVLFSLPSRCFSSILSPYHYCSLPLQGLLLHSLTLPLPLLFSSTPGASPPFSHLTTTTTVLFSPLQMLLLHSLTLPLLFSSLSPPGASSPFSHLTATVLFSLPSRCFSSILSPYHYHYCSLLSPLQVLLLHSLSLPLPLLFSSLSPPGASPPFSYLTTTTTVLFSLPSRCFSSILLPYHYHYCSLLSPLQVLLLHSLTLPLLFSSLSPPGASPPFSHLTTTTTVLFSLLFQVLLLYFLSLPLPLLFSSLSPPGASPPFSYLTTTVLLPSRCFSSILSPYHYHYCSLLSPLQVLLLHSLTLPLLFSSLSSSMCFFSILSPYHYHYCSLLSPLQVLLLHSLSLPLPLLFSSLSPPGASPPFSYLTTTTTVLFSLPSRCFSSILLPYHYHYCSLLSPLQVLLLHSLTLPLLFSLPLQVLLPHSLTLPLLLNRSLLSPLPYSHLPISFLLYEPLPYSHFHLITKGAFQKGFWGMNRT